MSKDNNKPDQVKTLVVRDVSRCLSDIFCSLFSKECRAKQVQSTLEVGVVAGTTAACGSPLLLSLPGKVTLEMLWCPAGTFMMGSPDTEVGRNLFEYPHRVTLSQGFWLGKYPVTQAQYEAVTGSNPAHFVGANHPVECISWKEASAFCDMLKLLPALGLPKDYRFSLPTEAQWEYACRAGTSSAFNSGKELTSARIGATCPNLDELGWYRENSDDSTHSVGEKLPNAWGFYDMHGNVWEWCQNFGYSDQEDITDPQGPSEGRCHTNRGGSWHDGARFSRSAFGGFASGIRYDHLGFRLALVLPPQQD